MFDALTSKLAGLFAVPPSTKVPDATGQGWGATVTPAPGALSLPGIRDAVKQRMADAAAGETEAETRARQQQAFADMRSAFEPKPVEPVQIQSMLSPIVYPGYE
jgi:hypothetical protein